MTKAAIIYWSKTGNTKKVADAIEQALSSGQVEVRVSTPQEADAVDWFDYDLVCIGFPSYYWHPPVPMDDYLKRAFARYRKQNRVHVGAPHIPGKHALIFCTYSGQHTGLDEATPAGDYAGQFFAHLGFSVLAKWYIVGEYHGLLEANTLGRLGDIRGRPDDQDQEQVRRDTRTLLERIQQPRVPSCRSRSQHDGSLQALAAGVTQAFTPQRMRPPSPR